MATDSRSLSALLHSPVFPLTTANGKSSIPPPQVAWLFEGQSTLSALCYIPHCTFWKHLGTSSLVMLIQGSYVKVKILNCYFLKCHTLFCLLIHAEGKQSLPNQNKPLNIVLGWLILRNSRHGRGLGNQVQLPFVKDSSPCRGVPLTAAGLLHSHLTVLCPVTSHHRPHLHPFSSAEDGI